MRILMRCRTRLITALRWRIYSVRLVVLLYGVRICFLCCLIGIRSGLRIYLLYTLTTGVSIILSGVRTCLICGRIRRI